MENIDFQKSLNDPVDIGRKLCEYILNLTEVSSTILWVAPQEGVESYTLLTPENKLLQDTIADELGQIMNNLRNEEEATMVKLVDSWYYIVPVKTALRFYGLIGVFWDQTASVKSKERLLQNVKVLSELSTIIFDKLHTENITVKSIVEMERKRIGEEIHDLISGQLFSAVCAASVLSRLANVNEKEREQLSLISSTVNQALRNLRSIIYSLEFTSNKQWFQKIKRYLDESAKLHGISVTLQMSEEIENIESLQAKTVYRIVCEAASNAIKHGHCENLSIEIINEGSEIRFIITDDGVGFEPNNSSKEHRGLGLCNISRLVHSINPKLRCPFKVTRIQRRSQNYYLTIRI